MSSIDFIRIMADPDGGSHFEIRRIDLATNDYAPPAPPLLTSRRTSAEASVFLELPAGWYGDWHPTPVRQWLILMSGECEFEVADGERCRRRAGDVVMLDDTTGKGHRTRVSGDTPARIAAVHFGDAVAMDFPKRA